MSTFPTHKNVIMACHITGIYDVNRSYTLPNDDYSLVKAWADSVIDLKLNGIIFHNNFSESTCTLHQNKYVSFVRVEYDPQFNPNVFRYLIYRDFLRVHAHAIESLFVTDVSDVVALNNPFSQALFSAHPEVLFCGDEPKRLNNPWMREHAAHLRSKIADYAAYESEFAESPLLNCGIIGGNIAVMRELIDALAFIHETYNRDNTTAYTGDMGAFNYVARIRFKERLWHGAPVNTVFKSYETDRRDCWFRHK